MEVESDYTELVTSSSCNQTLTLMGSSVSNKKTMKAEISLNIENYIEAQYRELHPKINIEYEDLYSGIEHSKLKEIFATLHYIFLSTYKMMNERLPTVNYTAHFWAEPSRDLIKAIEILFFCKRASKH